MMDLGSNHPLLNPTARYLEQAEVLAEIVGRFYVASGSRCGLGHGGERLGLPPS
jgi:hypothetical protein